MTRYETTIEGSTIYVTTERGGLEVGTTEEILDLIGGPAWTIRYSDAEKQRYPDLDTTDEGLTVDVVDTISAMTFGERFVDVLTSQPVSTDGPEEVSPRTGLFVGRLLENLEYGIR